MADQPQLSNEKKNLCQSENEILAKNHPIGLVLIRECARCNRSLKLGFLFKKKQMKVS